MVRKEYSVPETPSYGTGYIFIRRHSVPETPSYGTGHIFIRRHSVPETASYGTGCIFSAHNKKRDAEKLHPHNQFTQAIKP